MKTTGPLERPLFNDFGRASLMLVLSGLLLGSCAGGGLEPSPEEGGSAVQFTVSAVQEPDTRALRTGADDLESSPGGPDAYLSGSESPDTSRIIACTSECDLGEVYLIESEEEYGDCGAGAHTLTRAEMTTAITEKFSTIGYRATSASGVNGATPWFHNAETNPDGTLVTPVYWSDAIPHARFHGIYPYTADVAGDKIRLSPASHGGTPYVDFEAEPNVTGQQDLLTACSGPVHYATSGVHPRTDLKFRHALTAVKFAVGANLSWNKVIDRVEIRNACGQGRYTVATDAAGTGAAWSAQDGRRTFALGGGMQGGTDYGTIAVNTAQSVGTVIMGRTGDNSVFYMVPQTLTGAGVTAYVHFTDNTSITATLTGEWRPGTVKTYSLSNTSSGWEYKLEASSPAPVAYDVTTTGVYTVKSWREAPDGTKQPVSWEILGYDADGDGTFAMSEQPAWLTSLSKTSGSGSEAGETGTATLTVESIVDLFASRTNAMKDAAPKGTSENPWNLSNIAGEAVVQNTANSYVISAPGWYRIPLVYGNAIKTATPVANLTSSTEAGTKNESAYKTTNIGTKILSNFVDHNERPISDPWITQTNGGSNVPNGAKLVWADGKDLVKDLQIVGTGTNAFVQFRVPEQTGTGTDLHGIHNANAVIAVTKANTVVWSWHLWFAPADVLETTACTNFTGYTYHFTNETLGWKYTAWSGTTYTSPRSVKVKVEQTVANGGVKKTDVITITQNHYSVRQGMATYYQFGRKDPRPYFSSDTPLAEGSYTPRGGNFTHILLGIQNPNIFYVHGWGWTPTTDYHYINLWSMDNTLIGSTAGYNDNNVVKSIYDPCPAGFKMPAGNAFSGFTTTGGNISDPSKFNVSGAWDNGWNFNNKITNPDATVYFPALGYCSPSSGNLEKFLSEGFYWTAVTSQSHLGCTLRFVNDELWLSVQPKDGEYRALGSSVRPVRDVDFGGGHSGGEPGGGLGD